MREYLSKPLFMSLWSEWNCINCSQPITFDGNRRIKVALIFGGYLFAILLAKDFLPMNSYLWILLVIILFLGTVFIYAALDRFRAAQ